MAGIKKKTRMIIKPLLILLAVCLIFFLYVRYLEDSSIFYPNRTILLTPADKGLSYEEVFIPTPEGIKICGWFFPNPEAQSTLLFLHGNAGNIGDRLNKITAFLHMGVNVFIIDYRGYGKSEGVPSEEGIYQDAVAAYDYLINRGGESQKKIIAYGASLGGAVAIDLAAKRSLAALIVDSSFSSAADVSRVFYPFIPTFLLKTKMDSAGKIKNIFVPKLIIHSREDELIPIRLGKKLYEAAVAPKKFLEISGGHNADQAEDPVWREGIKEFLKENGLITTKE